jgi:hypothetical protein
VPPFPKVILDRHQARMLEPADALLLAGQRAPLPTAYRSGVMLMPQTVSRRSGALQNLNKVLGEFGLYLDDTLPGQQLRTESNRVWPCAVRQLRGAPPGRVDAWQALQLLRAAVARGDQRIQPEHVAGIGLDHLMVGSAVAGAGSQLFGVNWVYDGSGESGPPTASANLSRYDGPSPVSLSMPAPVAPKSVGQRRATVVTLDTGVGPHPWFTDDYLAVYEPIQQAVIASSATATPPGQPLITDANDGPPITEPLLGVLATHFGHGTFIAGIIRQLAPAAQIRTARVMHSDGVAYESDLLAALYELVEQVERSRAGDPDALAVDVLSLSLGYFHEDGDTTNPELVQLLDTLTGLGVIVVAAAGNFATTRPFFPAALAPRYAGGPGAPLVSVGALNPNGSVALFSDEGPWVTAYATGAAMVSTYPTVSVGGLQPEYSVDGGRRQALDGDDFSEGFAVWSGTSFAAPAVAGTLAAALEHNAADNSALSLDATSTADAVARAQAAMAGLGV